jgi:hypothetical protein
MPRAALVALACLAALPSRPAAAATIQHDGVGCVVAEQYPRLQAVIAPPETVARARVLFRAEGTQHWYAVAMKREGTAFTGVLPRPKRDLKRFAYYLEVADTSLGTSRTPEYTPDVVAGMGACRQGMMAASVPTATVVVEAPTGAVGVPAGFAPSGVAASGTAAGAGAAASTGGGIGGTTLLVAGGVVAAGAGVAVAVGGGGGGNGGSGGTGGTGGSGGSGGSGGGSAPGSNTGPEVPIARIRAVVYTTFGVNPANPTGPGLYGPPAVGARVSTSLDSTTTTTDASGRFDLVTQTRLANSACTPFALIINAAGQPTFNVSASWAGNNGREEFTISLSPPMPAPFVSTCTP